jgi:hypothetical protein
MVLFWTGNNASINEDSTPEARIKAHTADPLVIPDSGPIIRDVLEKNDIEMRD